MDQSLLYVASTRAMHKLEISITGKPSPFLGKFSPIRLLVKNKSYKT